MKKALMAIGNFIVGIIQGILLIALLVVAGVFIGGGIALVIAVILPLAGLIEVTVSGDNLYDSIGELFRDLACIFTK